jgi:hypothetical protein
VAPVLVTASQLSLYLDKGERSKELPAPSLQEKNARVIFRLVPGTRLVFHSQRLKHFSLPLMSSNFAYGQNFIGTSLHMVEESATKNSEFRQLQDSL